MERMMVRLDFDDGSTYQLPVTANPEAKHEDGNIARWLSEKVEPGEPQTVRFWSMNGKGEAETFIIFNSKHLLRLFLVPVAAADKEEADKEEGGAV